VGLITQAIAISRSSEESPIPREARLSPEYIISKCVSYKAKDNIKYRQVLKVEYKLLSIAS
jgi:hypothetical protein